MLKSIAAGITIFITGLFGAHSARPAIQGQLTAAAVSAVDVAPQSIALASASPFDPPATTTVINQYITNPVIERTIQFPPATDDAALNTRLQQFANSLKSEIYLTINSGSQTVSSPPASGGVWNAIALSNKIDQLANITISSATVHGVSGLTASDIPSLSYLPLSGGTVMGDLTVSGAFSGGSLSLSVASTSNLVAANATSTNLFATLGHFTTGIIDTLTSTVATITNLIATTITGTNAVFTNATTTNATSTNLYAGNLSLGTALSVANGGTGATTALGALSNFQFLQSWTGAVARGVSSKLADTVSVKDFGAQGDGITDDTTSIQNALNSGAGSIFLPCGTYYVGQLSIPSRTEFYGQSACSVLKAKAALNAAVLVLQNGYTERVYVHDFTIDGNASNQSSTSAHGIYFNNSDLSGAQTSANSTIGSNDPRQRIEDVLVTNTAGDGIYVDGRGATFISSVQVYKTGGYGIHLDAWDSYIQLADIGATAKSGLLLDLNAGSTRVSSVKSWYTGWNGSAFTGIDGDGVRVLSGGVILTNIETQDNGANGLYINGVSDVTVAGFRSQDAGRAASNTYSAIKLNSASNNTIMGAYARGVVSGTQYAAYAVSTSGGSAHNTMVFNDYSDSDFLSGVIDRSDTNVDQNNIQFKGTYYGTINFAGLLNTSSTGGGYQIDGGTVLYASSTNFITFGGIGAGAGIIAHATSSSSTSGPRSTAFGYSALQSGSNSAGDNTAIGYLSINHNTTGTGNTGVGVQSLSSNTTGPYNTGVGYFALQANTTGAYNTALGFSLYGNTTGSRNLAGGTYALSANKTGNDNVSLGYFSFGNNTSATNTVAIGSSAAAGAASYNNQGGVAVGYKSGFNFASGSDYNTLLGYQSGYNITTGSNNLILATATSSTSIANLTTGSQNILIGNNISLPSATASGQLNIGNILFGTGITGTGSTISSGLIGIGTTSPTTALQVNGVITPNVDNTSSLGNATYRWSAVYAANGTIQTSDQRLKSNITDLNYGLSDVLKLRPVSFTWTAQPQQGTQLGFIAQEVQPLFPETVNVGDDANHTLGLTYTEFIPVVVRSIQQLAQKIGNFADSFTTKELTFTRATGDEIAANKGTFAELCAKKSDGTNVCVTGDQLAAILASQGSSGSSAPSSSSASSSPSPDTEAPVITIDGENPAHIHVGDSYADLGASVTDNVDQNLGLKYFLNGALVSNIVIDTSAAATDTIDYVATDNAGNTSTSTRTVIIESPATAEPAPTP
jgi:hypothetical protein